MGFSDDFSHDPRVSLPLFLALFFVPMVLPEILVWLKDRIDLHVEGSEER